MLTPLERDGQKTTEELYLVKVNVKLMWLKVLFSIKNRSENINASKTEILEYLP